METGARPGRWQAVAGVGVAHLDAPLRISPVGLFTREMREEEEDRILASGATRSALGARRAIPEPPDPLRTGFQRDVDRILHCTPWRRTAGKTQVFVWNKDHQRTRMTHALEVTQIGESIARAARLNVDLVRAICLGHDLGHGPFGHASERALAPLVAGGFDHALWGANVTAVPLNLTEEVLDGIRHHSWSLPTPLTPEGAVASLADRLAYLASDAEDALAAGVVTPSDFPPDIWRAVGGRKREFIADVIGSVLRVITETGIIGFELEVGEVLQQVRDFAYARIYHRPASEVQGAAVAEFLPRLVLRLAEEAPEILDVSGGQDDETLIRSAVGYVVGCTDKYSIDLADQYGVAVPVAIREHAV
jgi:dGTPase